MESCGIHETTYNSIMKCDVDIRKDLYSELNEANKRRHGHAAVFDLGMAQESNRRLLALAPEFLFREPERVPIANDRIQILSKLFQILHGSPVLHNGRDGAASSHDRMLERRPRTRRRHKSRAAHVERRGVRLLNTLRLLQKLR